MKSYPHIHREPQNVPIYAFDKLDGSNIRAEWTRKKGFWKFGSRKRLVGEDEAILGRAQGLILDKYGDDLTKVFRKQRWQKAVAFFELHGPNSFAGWHDENDEFDVTLFDIAEDNRGIMEPRAFLKVFGHLDHAPLLYSGNANQPFRDSVQSGELDGMTFEGVVCKGKHVSPGLPLMFKLKNRAWIDKLKNRCGDDEKLFQELL